MPDNGNLKKGNPDTQFRSGREAVEAGRKGGQKSGVARRKKNASRTFLKQVLAMQPEKTADMIRALEKIGADPDAPLTVEQVGVLALVKKFMSGDLRAFDMVHEYLAEDPHTQLEEKRLKMQQEAVDALKNSDGFMEAMTGVVEEVFEDGGDTPDSLEDE